jgi:hypothetical protein
LWYYAIHYILQLDKVRIRWETAVARNALRIKNYDESPDNVPSHLRAELEEKIALKDSEKEAQKKSRMVKLKQDILG